MKSLFSLAGIFLLSSFSTAIAQNMLSGTLPCNTTLTAAGSPYVITSDVTILPGCVLNAQPGVEIRVAEGVHMIVKGKVNFAGTAAQPIWIHAKDTTWGNIFLDSTLNQRSTFTYVIIENARKSIEVGQEPGSIYGYFSSMEIRNCRFKRNLRCVVGYKCAGFLVKDCIMDSTNKGEKILGQYCNGGKVEGNILYATRGDCDAIDFDASRKVFIGYNQFYSGDDDAIDIGQCDTVGCDTVEVVGNKIFNMTNKGVSNGEMCLNISIHHNLVVGCGLGIGAKSGAHVKADHNTLYKNRVGVRSYHHINQVWGPGHLTVTNCIVANSDTTYLIDQTAYLNVSYSLSDNGALPGTTNFIGNPAFVSAGTTAGADFHLTAISDAIDAGDPGYSPDPDGTRSDLGMYFFNQLSGMPRYFSFPGVQLYPNPCNRAFFVGMTEPLQREAYEVRVLSTAGELVYSESFIYVQGPEDHKIALVGQPQGVYYIQVISNKGAWVGKLISN